MSANDKRLPSIIEEQGASAVIAGHFIEPDNYSIRRPVGMSDWLITYTLDGSGYFLIDGEERFCQAGDVTLMQPGVPHQYGTREGGQWNFIWAHFTSRITETNLLPDQKLLIHAVDNQSARRRIGRAFKRIMSDAFERGAYWSELCENTLREVILLLAQRHAKPLDPRIEEVRYLLSSRMREPVRIEDLAREVGLSPSRLSHLYKESTGMGIIDSLNDMRIRQAAVLLEHTGRSATDVAADVGFENYNHFANQFRKRFGVNPRTYKGQYPANPG
ncbi:helix-turn-helix domain-containing protein [Paenibacillus rhizovicinus]|uniref:Helix-turn-helix domain-containing protein n=1 Tax=Paenibacillus rhizovicinus TaxID=2704463 RepID=A0A6C0P6V6_9BACL|nr:helix-turn-helix domain-containing protein [Paenibacillus rhizovicinus]QHW34091.1 helix-turn-helix domain-containing protein [Paenibacillus rhizovicinus]